MRARRSAKFAEYLSTYAILQHIGIHPTTLIEKRDAAVGIGVYVRDACDAGTSLFAVPSRRFCADSVLSKIGLQCHFTNPWETAAPSSALLAVEALSAPEGIIAFLVGSPQWATLAWRLALEQQRSVSHLWGWLQSLPSSAEFQDQNSSAERHCRVHHTMLLPYYLKGRQRIEEETRAAYQLLRHNNLLPSYTSFCWAVEVLLTRSLLIPAAWPESAAPQLCTVDGDEAPPVEAGPHAALELRVVPFVDLVNAPDSSGRTANAEIEVASTLEELPVFFKEEMTTAWAAKGRDGLAELEALLQTHYLLCLTLLEPLRASEEVIVDWPVPSLTTGVLQTHEDEVLSRLLRYKF